MNRSDNRLLPVLAAAISSGGVKPPSAQGRKGAQTPFVAQLFCQGEAKRGLRGGEPVLKAARSAYLCAEYSGEQDRRFPAGIFKRTSI